MPPSRRQVCTTSTNRKRRVDTCYCTSRFIKGAGAFKAVLHGLLLSQEWLTKNKYYFESHGVNEVFRLASSYFEVGSKVLPGVDVEAITFVSLRQPGASYNFRSDQQFNDQTVMALWHGCNMDDIGLILSGAWKLPKKDTGSKCGMGLYFSTCSAYACSYCSRALLAELPALSHYYYVLLCEVVSGVSYETSKELKGLERPPDVHDSVRGIGKYTQDRPEDYVDSKGVIWPLAPFVSKRQERADHEFPLDEVVVYDPKRVNVTGFYEFKFAQRK